MPRPLVELNLMECVLADKKKLSAVLRGYFAVSGSVVHPETVQHVTIKEASQMYLGSQMC